MCDTLTERYHLLEEHFEKEKKRIAYDDAKYKVGDKVNFLVCSRDYRNATAGSYVKSGVIEDIDLDTLCAPVQVMYTVSVEQEGNFMCSDREIAIGTELTKEGTGIKC